MDTSERTRAQEAIGVEPLRLPFDQALRLPGSKSDANRALVAAALAPGETVVHGATPCDDVAHMVENLAKLGFGVAWTDRARGIVRVAGGLPARAAAAGETILDCGNAGTTLRFLVALACLVPGRCVVTGSPRMRERPIGDLVKALRMLGAEVEVAGGVPPVRIRGGRLAGGRTRLDAGKSSQFLSALLLIGPALDRGLEVATPAPPASASYLDLTCRVLESFGAGCRRGTDWFQVAPSGYTSPGRYEVEGDWSAAGAFLVLARITGSRFRGCNLRGDSTQGDRELPEILARLAAPGDVTFDVARVPDQLMNLAVFAAHRAGTTILTGARNLRLKESDRLAVIARELAKAGVRIEQHEDGVAVSGPTRLRPALFDPAADHRMAMAFAILGATAPGMRIADPGCVDKSYPGFFDDLRSLSRAPLCLAVVGMRGAGKTTFATDLALKLGLEAVDTDRLFQARCGPIPAFVARHGWAEFRAREEEIVAAALRPGRVVALGGGALESKRTWARLLAPAADETAALAIHLEEEVATLVARLAGSDRPPLTGLSPVEEVETILARRRPVYRQVAAITLRPGLSRDQRVAAAAAALAARCRFDPAEHAAGSAGAEPLRSHS